MIGKMILHGVVAAFLVAACASVYAASSGQAFTISQFHHHQEDR